MLDLDFWMAHFSAALADDAELSVRAERAEDAAFTTELYTQYRWSELAEVPWTDAQKKAFLATQAQLQSDHYHRNYLGAIYLIFERAQQAIGRLYLYASASEYRLMEIMFLEAQRGRGIGTRLIQSICAQAQLENRRVTLHVEPNNPAQRLYRRLGFAFLEDRGTYHFLGWSPETANTPNPKTYSSIN